MRGAPAATRARARAIFLSDRPHAFRWRDFSRRKTRAYGTKSGFSSSGSIFRIAESISNPDWTPPETDVIQVKCPWNPFRGRSDARHPDRAAGGAAGTALVWSRRYANTSRGTECISKTVVCICYAFIYIYISEVALLRSESAIWFGRDVRMNATALGVRVGGGPATRGEEKPARARPQENNAYSKCFRELKWKCEMCSSSGVIRAMRG